MIDPLPLSREVTKVGIPSAHADAIAVSATCTRAETRGVTDHHRVGGSGAPGTPPPLGNGRAMTLSILFSPADRTRCWHRRRGRPAGRQLLEQLLEHPQNCY